MSHVLVESERLLVRRPEDSDRGLLERIFCDPEMMRYLGSPWTPDTVAETLWEWHDEWGVEKRWSGVLLRRDTRTPGRTSSATGEPAPGRAGAATGEPASERAGAATGGASPVRPGEPIGTAGLTDGTVAGEPGLELSWFVLPEQQRQDFAAEITGALLRFAFEEVGAERVLAETHPQNPAANRVLRKLGFVCLGERRHAYDYLPNFETQVLWTFTRDAWPPAR